MPPTLQQLLKAMVDNGASDLHVTTETPPQLRIDGSLVKLRTDNLSSEDTKAICYSVLTETQKARFEEDRELDFSFAVKGLARFRANLFIQRGNVGGAFRVIPFKVRSFAELDLPPIVAEMCTKHRGLILVTGPTGSGKSTTLASMIDKINMDTRGHIITIEDPIEFMHEHKSCVVNQREVGTDTESFRKALRFILRQDPDVVLIGELRDLETIEAAMSIAETGHLCLATLHTNGALQTINRIIDAFPASQQGQIRSQLSFVLAGVLSQMLLPRIGGGVALALEVLVPTAAVRNLIREDKAHQIYSQMQIGQGGEQGSKMQTMNQSLALLVQTKAIMRDTAMDASSDTNELKGMLDGKSGAPRPYQGR